MGLGTLSGNWSCGPLQMWYELPLYCASMRAGCSISCGMKECSPPQVPASTSFASLSHEDDAAAAAATGRLCDDDILERWLVPGWARQTRRKGEVAIYLCDSTRAWEGTQHASWASGLGDCTLMGGVVAGKVTNTYRPPTHTAPSHPHTENRGMWPELLHTYT